jgi:hypothetical protein
MKRKLLLPLLLVTVLFAVSCKKSGNTGLLVPEDAAIVFHINSSSLTSKLSWDEIRQTQWFKKLSEQATDSLAQQLLSDPSQSGIDTKADFVVFLKKVGKNGYVVFEGSLKDAAAFETLNKKIHESGTSSKDGAINYMTFSKKAALAWNSTHFTYVMGIPMPDMGSALANNYNEFDDVDEDDNAIPTDSLKLFGKTVLNLKGSDKLDSDSRFVSMIKDGSDMHVWMNTEEYYGEMMEPMLSMIGNLSALTKGNVSATSFNFDNGKMTMSSKQFYGKEMSSFISKYDVKPVSAETAARIPSENVIAALAMNYPPEAIPGFFKLLKIDGFINSMMTKTGYSVEEFVKANKGEILLAVTDFQMKQKSDTFDYGAGEPIITNNNEPDAKVFLATSVKDKAAFEKMVTIVWDAMKSDKATGEITYKLDNNWFAIGNSAEQVNQFIAGGTKSKGVFVDKISGHPMGVYLDLRKIFQVGLLNVKDSTQKSALTLADNTWESVSMWGGEYKDKAVQFNAEVAMVDKNTNSLKQLNSFVDRIATMFINKEKMEGVKDVELKAF